MNEPKYISQRTQLQKQIRLQRRIRLEHSPSMDVVFVAARSTADISNNGHMDEVLQQLTRQVTLSLRSENEFGCGIRSVVEDDHTYSEGRHRSPEEYEPIQDTPIHRIQRSYDNLHLLPDLLENSGRCESSGQRALLATTESRQAELAEDSREFLRQRAYDHDVKQEAPPESSEEDISFPHSVHQEPIQPLPNECGIRSEAWSPEEYESSRDIVLNNHNHKWKRKLVYIGCTTVVSGCITIIVTLSLIFASMYAPIVPTTSSSSPNPVLFPNTTTIRNHTITISGFYTIERSDTSHSLIKFKGDGHIQFTETVIGQVLLVGGGGGVGWGGGILGIGPGTGGGGGGGVGVGKLTFYAGEIYIIHVGIGGIVRYNNIGNSGGETSIQGKGILEYAHGGGAGGYYFRSSHYGGSSGGNYGFTGYVSVPNIQYATIYYNNTFPGKATRGNGTLTYHGYPGGNGLPPYVLGDEPQFNSGSGGGGAGGPGSMSQKNEGGQGGPGYQWSITQEYYGAGGGGGGCTNCIGGIGGGGSGSDGGGGGGTVPSPNSGGGGGGGTTFGNGFGTSGASGIVVIAL